MNGTGTVINNGQMNYQPGIAIQIINPSNSKLPESITIEQFEELIDLLRKFLLSKEAEDLRVKDYNLLKEQIDSISEEDKRIGKGWEQIRGILGDAANATTLLTPIISFASTHGHEIAQSIQTLFQAVH